MDKLEDEVRMSIKASRKFQQLLNALAGAKGISRDTLIERAVRIAYAEEIALIEPTIEVDDDTEELTPTQLLPA